jgi:hypothetical protein
MTGEPRNDTDHEGVGDGEERAAYPPSVLPSAETTPAHTCPWCGRHHEPVECSRPVTLAGLSASCLRAVARPWRHCPAPRQTTLPAGTPSQHGP